MKEMALRRLAPKADIDRTVRLKKVFFDARMAASVRTAAERDFAPPRWGAENGKPCFSDFGGAG